jgi:hypothetical protein
MNLNDLLRSKDVDPRQVVILRHRPWESELNRVLPWLAAEKPDVFNAYQQTQGDKKVEQAVLRAEYIASFIGREPGRALFVGLYLNKGSRQITRKQFWKIPANVELKSFGMAGFTKESPRRTISWFDLSLTDLYAHWKGKLIVGWPGLERSWYRWAHKPKNEMPVLSILDESALDAAMPEWQEIDLTWEDLGILPKRWKSAISQWRVIYYIFDTSDGKGYVGSAYGHGNLLHRWQNYAARGHGGNRLLRQRDPKNFRFTILQRVSPDMDKGDVIRLESTWKDRLHTRHPSGLNDN